MDEGSAFIGCPGDVIDFAEIIKATSDRIANETGVASPFHWAEGFDLEAALAGMPIQFQLPSTRRDVHDPIFILLANRIGTPLRPSSDGWGDWHEWLDANGWPRIALVGEIKNSKLVTMDEAEIAGALPGEEPLPFDLDARRMGRTEDQWLPWRISRSPAGTIVELPWICEDRLERGRVILPLDGLNSRIDPRVEVLAKGVGAKASRFVFSEDGQPTPFRARMARFSGLGQ